LSEIRKLMICPWFGDEPVWANRWHASAGALAEHGYDFLHDRDLDEFKQRVQDVLGIRCPIVPGGSKIHDFRPAFGELYRDELEGYDFWGHTDYDCVYGRVDRFVTDELLASVDIQTDNVYSYLSGPWTLYRNDPRIAALYTHDPEWAETMEASETTGWVETSFTEIAKRECVVDIAQHHAFTEPHMLWTDGDRLMHGADEISFYHFRRTKEWPLVRLVEP
jgi:Family of unknown function (DUF6625)